MEDNNNQSQDRHQFKKSEQDNPECKIVLTGIGAIPETKKVNALKGFLGTFGKCKSLTIDPKHGRFAIVHFVKEDSVKEILMKNKHDNYKISGVKICAHPYEMRKHVSEDRKNTPATSLHNDKCPELRRHDSVMGCLSSAADMEDQLQRLTEVLRLTEQDEKIRNEIRISLRSILDPYFEDFKIYLFGSSLNHFGAKECDLDLFIDFEPVEERFLQRKPTIQLPPHKKIKSLKFDYGPLSAEDFQSVELYDRVKLVAKLLSWNCRKFESILPIPSKRCPLVKFSDRLSKINCDLSFNNRKALYNSRLLRFYSSNPKVLLVVMAIRYWAKIQELCGSSFAISSYAMTLMVLYFLMHRQPPLIPHVWDIPRCIEGVNTITVNRWDMLDIPAHARLTPSDNLESPVDLVREFFHFYANEVNWEDDVILTGHATIISRESFQERFPTCQVGCMNMVDPFDLSHNVLIRVTEKSKFKFIEEMTRASKLSQEWSCLPLESQSQSQSAVWGIASIFVPNPNPTIFPSSLQTVKNGKNKKKDLLKGQNKNGNFVINFVHMKTGPLSSHGFWCSSVRNMLVDILTSVLMVDMKLEGISFSDTKDAISDVNKGEQLTEAPEELSEEGEREDSLIKSGTLFDNLGRQIPLDISLKESLIECDAKSANCSEKHKVKSIKRADVSEAHISALPPGISQFMRKEKSKVIPSVPNKLNSSSHQKTTPTLPNLLITPENGDISNGCASRVKRSSTEACLDKGSSILGFESCMHLTDVDERLSQPSTSKQKISAKSPSKPISKTKRLRLYDDIESQEKGEVIKKKVNVISSTGVNSSRPVSVESNELKDGTYSGISKPEEKLIAETNSDITLKNEKSSRVTKYSCVCSHPVWFGRNKVKNSMSKSMASLQGFALEREISRTIIKNHDKDDKTTTVQKGDCGTTLDKDSSPVKKLSIDVVNNVDAEVRRKKALLTSLKKKDDTIKEDGQLKSSSVSASQQTDGSRTSLSSPSDDMKLKFSCQILEKRISEAGSPLVKIIFSPLTEHVNSFKNLFLCAQSMMRRIISDHL